MYLQQLTFTLIIGITTNPARAQKRCLKYSWGTDQFRTWEGNNQSFALPIKLHVNAPFKLQTCCFVSKLERLKFVALVNSLASIMLSLGS